MQLIYGTWNPAKLETMRGITAPLGTTLIGLRELGAGVPDAAESGSSPLENARQKALAYYSALRCPVFSCDSGLYIEGVPDKLQPGVHIRRPNGVRLGDAQTIEYYAKLAESLGGQCKAQYHNAICLVMSDSEILEHCGEDIRDEPFIISSVPHPRRTEGFPLDSLSVEIASGKYYYDLYGRRSGSERRTAGFQAFFKRAAGV